MNQLRHIWSTLGLPLVALDAANLVGEGLVVPSSFKVADLAQTTIATTGLLAALIHAKRNDLEKLPIVTVDREHACAEFSSERLYLLNGDRPASDWGPIGGLHKTSDGYVRVHDVFRHHREGACALLGLPVDATRDQVANKIASWAAIDLETAAVENRLVMTALRTFSQWDATPHAQVLPDFPISITKLAEGERMKMDAKNSKCLEGLRVLEMSRIIAAPVAGRTLAAHGADVLWITSPKLPDLPSADPDLSRGKRTAHIHFTEDSHSLNKLLDLTQDADVFLQSYRPGSLNAKGLSAEKLLEHRKGHKPLIYASLSAYGNDGPWKMRKGYDSLVQTCSGMNASEAAHAEIGEAARPLPCQALDHGAGYFLAAGIMTALYRQMTEGGSFRVDVSLAAVMKYMRSLGQFEGCSGFSVDGFASLADLPTDFVESKMSDLGRIDFVKHASQIAGVDVSWSRMPKRLGSDQLEWLLR